MTPETITASIEERGNGFPDVGDAVSGDDGTLYRVVVAGSRIETQGCGAGSVCSGYQLAPFEWDDLEDGEEVHPSLAIL